MAEGFWNGELVGVGAKELIRLGGVIGLEVVF